MRTSVDVPDHLLALARSRALAEHTTLREVLIASLSRYLLDEPQPPTPTGDTPYQFPVLKGSGGMHPDIDPTDSSALWELE